MAFSAREIRAKNRGIAPEGPSFIVPVARLWDFREGQSNPEANLNRGFVITSHAYRYFMERNRLDEIVEGVLAGMDPSNPADCERAAAQIQRLMIAAPIPTVLASALEQAYMPLEDVAVAVEPVTVDGPGEVRRIEGGLRGRFAVTGVRNMLRSVRACWALLFLENQITSRMTRRSSHVDIPISISVLPALSRLEDRGMRRAETPFRRQAMHEKLAS